MGCCAITTSGVRADGIGRPRARPAALIRPPPQQPPRQQRMRRTAHCGTRAGTAVVRYEVNEGGMC
jgi:hypothetical protein